MPTLVNGYGDRRIVTRDGHGIDIASQRADDLDQLSLAYIKAEVAKGRPVFALDVGCGHGGQSVRMSKAGACVVALDANDYRASIQDVMRPEKDFVAFHCAAVEDEPEVGTFDVILAQRMIHYLPYAAASKALSWFFRIANPSAHLFLSASGLDSELGDQYPVRQEPIESRFAPLAPCMADKHAIHFPVCLYRPEELMALVAASGWTPEQTFTSPFGNVKLVARKECA